MKYLSNLLFVIVLVSVVQTAQAQLKVGNNPTVIHSAAAIEVESTTKGVLLPRMNTAQQNALNSPPDGMMLFNTDSACIVIRRGGLWRSVCAQNSGDAWSTLGNTGTTSSHFLGTTDNMPLNIRTNNVRSARLSPSSGDAFFGYQAGINNAGSNNTFIGAQAGDLNTTGSNNTIIGATADLTNNNLSNATALGYGATVDASNKIRLGNTSVTMVETYGNFVTISDRRLKTNIQDNAIGLEFIKAIRPVYYELNEQKGIIYDGFIAQEIEEILKKQNITNFSGLVKPSTEGGHYTISYATFVIPLVNAVKTLAEQNKVLQREVEQLRQENSDLKNKVEQNTRDIERIKVLLEKK